MRRVVCLLLVTALLAAQSKDTTSQVAERLQGSWTVVSAERNGQAADAVKGDTLTITGPTFTVKSKEGELKGTLKLGVEKKPPAVDFVHTDGPAKGVTLLGVYELQGDDWRICFAPADAKDRPSDLSAKAGSPNMVIVLKRDKK